MNGLTRPAITRIARKAGVKTISEDCFPMIRNLIGLKLHEIIKVITVVNSERNTKTIMPSDIYEALRLLGVNIAQTTEL